MFLIPWAHSQQFSPKIQESFSIFKIRWWGRVGSHPESNTSFIDRAISWILVDCLGEVSPLAGVRKLYRRKPHGSWHKYNFICHPATYWENHCLLRSLSAPGLSETFHLLISLFLQKWSQAPPLEFNMVSLEFCLCVCLPLIYGKRYWFPTLNGELTAGKNALTYRMLSSELIVISRQGEKP